MADMRDVNSGQATAMRAAHSLGFRDLPQSCDQPRLTQLWVDYRRALRRVRAWLGGEQLCFDRFCLQKYNVPELPLDVLFPQLDGAQCSYVQYPSRSGDSVVV